jgi:NADP-dependent 3-hydroxy acid dehydrogenase YdfG
MTLDVTSPVSGAVIGEATKIFGWIDILVNNAGYSVLGAVEDIRYSHIPLT